MEDPQIIPPRVPLVDQRTGMIAREWFLWLIAVVRKGNDGEVLQAFDAAAGAAAAAKAMNEAQAARFVANLPVTTSTVTRKEVEDARLVDRIPRQDAQLAKQVSSMAVQLAQARAVITDLSQRLQDIQLQAVMVKPSKAIAVPPSSTDNAIARWDGTSGRALQNSTATIDDIGNTVVGYTSALTTFNGGAATPKLQVVGINTEAVSVGLARFGAASIFRAARSGGTTVGDYTAVGAAVDLYQIIAEGADGTDFAPAAQITFGADGVVAANQVPGRFSFFVADSGGTLREVMRFNSTLNIGIRATTQLNLDGIAATGDTYIVESAPNTMDFYAGGTNTLRLTSSTATVTGAVAATGAETILNATAIPAGGTAGSGYKFSSTSNFGTFFGSGAPSLSAAKGSLYLRSDGSGTTDRAYINTDGNTTWTALTTVA